MFRKKNIIRNEILEQAEIVDVSSIIYKKIVLNRLYKLFDVIVNNFIYLKLV